MFICVYVRRIHVSILFTTVTSSLSNKKKKKKMDIIFLKYSIALTDM